MTDKQQRIVDVLNRNLSPWTFTGEEPFALELFRVIEDTDLPQPPGRDTNPQRYAPPRWPDQSDRRALPPDATDIGADVPGGGAI